MTHSPPPLRAVARRRSARSHRRRRRHRQDRGGLGGLGCEILAYDPCPSPTCEALGARYVSDDVFNRLLTLPNVIITGHQAFFTREAMENIALTTVTSVRDVEETGASANAVRPAAVTANPES